MSSLLYNIIIIIICNLMINVLSLNHIKLFIEEINNKNVESIKKIDTDINVEINGLKTKQKHIEKSSKENEITIKKIEKNQINNKELKTLEEDLKKKIEEDVDNQNKILEENITKKMEEDLNNQNKILEENITKKMEEDLNNQKKNEEKINELFSKIKTNNGGSKNVMNEVRFLNKIKNTSLINIDDKDNVKISKMDTHVCTIKILLIENDILDINKKINYNYNKIINVTGNIYNSNNNNIIHIINPSNIQIIDGFCIIKDLNYIIKKDEILCIHLHLICDKYSFSS